MGNNVYKTSSFKTLNDVQSKLKIANESVTNDTTLQDDDIFQFSVVPGQRYLINIYIVYTAHEDSDLKVGWAYPVGATMSWGRPAHFDDGVVYVETQTLELAGVSAGAVGRGALLMALIANPTNAGSIKLQWAQQTAGLTATTIYAGSYGFCVRLS